MYSGWLAGLCLFLLWMWAFGDSHIDTSFIFSYTFYPAAAAAAAKLLQSCPTLCDPIDNSSPGSPAPGIPQARTLEWVAISFSNAWKWKVKVKSLRRVRLFATLWTEAYQAPPFMGFLMEIYKAQNAYTHSVPLPCSFQDTMWSSLLQTTVSFRRGKKTLSG